MILFYFIGALILACVIATILALIRISTINDKLTEMIEFYSHDKEVKNENEEK